jgi:hypothetical protein
MTLGFDKMELQQMEEERKDWDKRLTAIGRRSGRGTRANPEILRSAGASR